MRVCTAWRACCSSFASTSRTSRSRLFRASRRPARAAPCSALPLTCDFAHQPVRPVTPWEKIEQRLRAAQRLAISASCCTIRRAKRTDHLRRACDILLRSYRRKPSAVWCAALAEGESRTLTTLGELRDTQVDMLTTVFVGNSRTRVMDGRMVTPRGYRGV